LRPLLARYWQRHCMQPTANLPPTEQNFFGPHQGRRAQNTKNFQKSKLSGLSYGRLAVFAQFLATKPLSGKKRKRGFVNLLSITGRWNFAAITGRQFSHFFCTFRECGLGCGHSAASSRYTRAKWDRHLEVHAAALREHATAVGAGSSVSCSMRQADGARSILKMIQTPVRLAPRMWRSALGPPALRVSPGAVRRTATSRRPASVLPQLGSVARCAWRGAVGSASAARSSAGLSRAWKAGALVKKNIGGTRTAVACIAGR
jgi:hypothetical protein